MDHLLLLPLMGMAAGLLYVWLGVAYSLTLISLLTLSGQPLNPLMSSIIASQALTALAGSLYRTRSNRGVGREDARGIIVLAASSLVAFSSALAVGVRLADAQRSVVAVGILVASGVLMLGLSRTRRSRGECTGGGRGVSVGASQLASGLLGGLVKGIVGAGVTPIMLVVQVLACVDFSRVVFRTVSSEVALLIATFMPYAMGFGVEWAGFLLLALGSLAGVLAGGVVGLGEGRSGQGKLMGVSGAVTLALGLLGVVGVYGKV